MLEPGIRAALQAEATRYDHLLEQQCDPEVLGDPVRQRTLARESGGLRKRVERFRAYLALETQHRESQEMIDGDDAEMRGLAEEEMVALAPRLGSLAEELKRELLARHEHSDRNVILEIRAGAGGDEATLWSGDLARMYQRFAERKGFKCEVVTQNKTEVGGFKDVVLALEGGGVFDQLRFESGGHRVQRVPSTETQGRIHTSAATVAVMAEPDEVEVEIKEGDLKIDTFRAGGPGGQNVNKTSSAVRITHLPSGVVVSCQDESSQHKNKAKALRSLRSRLFDHQQQALKQARDSERRDQIGSGDRGDKIRTYNYPQDRVTDHRIQRSFHPLPALLDGQLDDLIAALLQHEIDRRLAALEESS